MKRPVVLAAALALCSCRTTPRAAPEAASPPAAAVSALPAIDEAALDRSVDPCEDFYAFACGGWIGRTEIPADKPRWSRGFDELRERNRAALRGILEADAAGRGDPQDRFVGKVGDYYWACMDEQSVEAHGLDELKAEWAKLDEVSDPATLATAVAHLTGAGLGVPFAFSSDQDAKDAARMIGIISQDGLSLPDRDYYLEPSPKMAEIRSLFGQHLRRMLKLAGLPAAEVEGQAQAIESFEHSLAESHWTRVEMRDPARIYNRVDLDGLERLAPHFPWRRYLAAIGHPDVRAISVTTPRNLEKIDALVAGAPLPTWRAYLKWHLLSALAHARALPQAFVQEDFAFRSAAFTGARELEARWKHCVSATDEALGEALGQSYVRLYFGAGGKQRSSRIVAEVEQAMQRDLEALAWMDPPTRAKALAKLHKVENKIGYPAAWRDYAALQVTRRSYFANALAAGAFEINRQLNRIGRPVDRKEWLMTPPTVNAYYNPSMNEMVFPAGILQPPFFNPTAPEAINYGAIGMVMAHELTHGFDDEGRRYDAEGNLVDWWTPAVSAEFDRRAECLVEQFDGYVAVDDLHLNGKLTLGENIADLGGLKLGYAAWARARAADSKEASVAGFTPEQQFFLGMAQAWCEKSRDPYARMLVTVDPHSPPRFRVNGPLSNLEEFAKAFQCRAGSKMARALEQRCAVW